MVQIKLSACVAFILAAAAIAPVVALPAIGGLAKVAQATKPAEAATANPPRSGGADKNAIDSTETKKGNQGEKVKQKAPVGGDNVVGKSKGGNVPFKSDSAEAQAHHQKLLELRKEQRKNRKEINELKSSLKENPGSEGQARLAALRKEDNRILAQRRKARNDRNAAHAAVAGSTNTGKGKGSQSESPQIKTSAPGPKPPVSNKGSSSH